MGDGSLREVKCVVFLRGRLLKFVILWTLYRKVVYKSRGLCAIFQLFGAASIRGRLCFGHDVFWQWNSVITYPQGKWKKARSKQSTFYPKQGKGKDEEREIERERGSNLRRRLGQPDCPGVSRSDHSAGSKESASWRALGLRSDWHGRLGLGGGRKKGKKQAEEAARTNRRRTKREWQLNEQREEINIDVEDREENIGRYMKKERKSDSGDRTYGGRA